MDDRSERIRVLLPNGTEIWAEAQGIGPKEAEVVGFDYLKGALSLDSLRDAIEGMGALALAALEKIKPEEVSVEFGLELAVDTAYSPASRVRRSPPTTPSGPSYATPVR